ncbi:pre-toxin TG domain-containing protein [Parageobacillus thermoglucosidasius]|uniref:pre-toxin TG domain-containing protein n=1 Tax=Parageobacillus thermoglucosidasius TaxID=1426 RepID=UPI003B6843EB
MTTIRIKLEELETVTEHVPDAEDGCFRAPTSLSWELPSLVMEIPGISTAAIDNLKDELIHWLDRYEGKLNEAEGLLYRTAAAIRQADQTLADNIKEFGLELLGWYDLQRVFGEYDPVTGERLSFGDRLFAGGMLLLSVIPPAKGAGIAGKAGIKGAKAAGIAADVSKLVSQTRHVLRYDKVMPALQAVYHQVVKAPISNTIRSFKKQWDDLLDSVRSVQLQPAFAGIGSVSRAGVRETAEEATSSVRFSMSQAVDGVVDKGNAVGDRVVKNEAERAKNLDLTPRETPYKIMGSKKMKILNEKGKNRTITREEWKQLEWNKRFKRRRDRGVDNFWEQEKVRVMNGNPTRNWTPEQIKDILNGNIPKHNGKPIIGHHAYSASKYPQIADKGEIIYPVTFREHLYRWHGGNYRDSLPGRPINDSIPNDF